MKQFFLLFGLPKSGTTFLQRMLDMHPEISCPSEQSFTTLTNHLNTLLANYERQMGVVARRTGGHAIPVFDADLRDNVFSALIMALATSFAGGKPICGMKENSVVGQIEYYDRILKRPKMIAIFRDPVDTAVSTWRHNRRLAQAEPHLAEKHLALLDNREGTLDGYVKRFAANYRSVTNAYLAYAGQRTNFITMSYEALVDDRSHQLRKLLRFLRADASAPTIRAIVDRSSREEMAKGAADPAFFGVDASATEEARVSDAVKEQVRLDLRSELSRLGFE